MKTLFLLALALAPAHAATLFRIACGSTKPGIDAAGHAWQADAFFTGGTAYWRSEMAGLDFPYRALRFGTFSYNLPTQAGKFSITLLFAENRNAASVPPIATGQRKIAVTINGTLVIPILDIFAMVGSLKPYSVVIPVTASGPLSISVAPPAGSSLVALLSGIQVDSVDTPPPPASVDTFYCENWIDAGGSGIGGLMPAVDYRRVSCENMEPRPVNVLSVRCRSDRSGAVLSLLIEGGSQSLIPTAPCTADGKDTAAPPGTVYPAGKALQWVFRANDSVDAVLTPGTRAVALGVASFVLATVVLQTTEPSALALSGGNLVLSPGSPVAALQWDLSSPVSLSPGPALLASGKRLDCQGVRCLATGINQTPIGAGTVATFTGAADLVSALAASPEGYAVPLDVKAAGKASVSKITR